VQTHNEIASLRRPRNGNQGRGKEAMPRAVIGYNPVGHKKAALILYTIMMRIKTTTKEFEQQTKRYHLNKQENMVISATADCRRRSSPIA
jgi:hypothetical protein